MLTRRPEHLKTFEYLGLHRYFLTFCTYDRHYAFSAHERVDMVRTQILRATTDERFALTAYCFMPDHLHMLIEGQADASDCRRFISRAKQFSGFYYQKTFRQRLWQRHGYERVLRGNEATLGVARYIIENPVRGGLARSASEYPFSGSNVYSIEEIVEAVQMWKPRSA